MEQIEKRDYHFENKSEEDMQVSGYAATFNQITTLHKIDGIEYKEVIHPDAFNGTDMKDCCLKYNHNDTVPILARTRGGSLKLSVDNIGLKFDAKLSNTNSARDIYTLVKEGVLDKCSFAFTIADGGIEVDRKTRTTTITKIEKLWDVAIVDNPAYESTSVSARTLDLVQMDIDNERMDIRKREDAKKRIQIKSRIIGGQK